VLGLKVVLADGTTTELGGRSLEAVGPDVHGLFVGSEGLFGVALEITLRLLPRAEAWFTLLAAYGSLEAAGKAVGRVIASGLLPAAMEIMDRLAIRAAEAAVHAGYPSLPALLIVELEGEALEVAAEAEVLRDVIAASGPTETRIARDAAERDRIWKGRKGAFSAVGRLSPDYIVQDGVVPRARLGEALAEVERLSREHGLQCANVFHAGDGTLHPLILFDGKQPGALERAETLAGEILRMCVRLGGSITGEHGVGLEKRAYLPEMYSASDMDAMQRLRLAFDPREISNRGKMLAFEAPGAAAPRPLVGQHPLERAGVIQRE
jgi:glycolate oxidase